MHAYVVPGTYYYDLVHSAAATREKGGGQTDRLEKNVLILIIEMYYVLLRVVSFNHLFSCFYLLRSFGIVEEENNIPERLRPYMVPIKEFVEPAIVRLINFCQSLPPVFRNWIGRYCGVNGLNII